MYLLDANIFIEAKNRYYGFDIAPGFWTWLDNAHAAGMVGSIDAVRTELGNGGDALAQWARERGPFFQKIDQPTTAYFGMLSTWAQSQNFTAAALAKFAHGDADDLLIAYAKAHDCTLVMHERSNPSSRKRIMILDACAVLDVPVTDPFEMLRREGARLDLYSAVPGR
ncbi:DUF4411 family protein [Tomitella fengzijianii]|uniref:DUF4411 family protein n=1 Tax=Tomitella fengzijianii TaxID=2597660 RepID=UPI00131A94D5|nr:DUF4411 family protein [Tomitella fengzijianii]